MAQLLTAAIALLTNLAFYGRLSLLSASPAGTQLGGWIVLVPVAGAVIVGFMARYGSMAIRGHGIPEAMEQVLFNQSRIPPRVLLLKPLSAVISIGTGGPFGAEGPIIATGGALGSLVGQFTRISADERKTLLAAGAAAGMAATFGTPVAAVLLAIELLLFEYRAASLIPVAFSAVAATGGRMVITGGAPAFEVPDLPPTAAPALAGYVVIGAVTGLASVMITKALYAIEDRFARLRIHWMWWPALGAVVVGLVGVVAPRTLGVGYDNIEQTVSGGLAGNALLALCAWKTVSWLIALGSGTSGGTLAPIFTIGGGIGVACAGTLAWLAPTSGVDTGLAALVGMAALFAGASHALLASVLFAFESTRQPLALLPLLAGCAASYLVSSALMRTSIMTEKFARRGRPVPNAYALDALAQVLVKDVALREVVTLQAAQTVGDVRTWFLSGVPGAEHQSFPVLADDGRLLGVVTQRDVFRAGSSGASIGSLLRRAPIVVGPQDTLRDAADRMLRAQVGRLPVVQNGRLVGIVTRTDVLEGHSPRLRHATTLERTLRLPLSRRGPGEGTRPSDP